MTNRDSTKRFSDRVEDYVKYRPGYPDALFDRLFDLCRPASIADIGAGTGIFSGPLLERGAVVYAVEPNTEMRAAAESSYGNLQNFNSVDAPAENTGLADSSIDLIVAAQAFHWFDNDATRAEFERILKPGGRLALIWNKRNTEQTLQRAYHELLIKLAPEYGRVNHMNLDDEDIAAFYRPGKCERENFANAQSLDLPALLGRLRSASYCPLETSDAYRQLVEAIEDLFERHARNGKIVFEYECRMYLGALRA